MLMAKRFGFQPEDEGSIPSTRKFLKQIMNKNTCPFRLVV